MKKTVKLAATVTFMFPESRSTSHSLSAISITMTLLSLVSSIEITSNAFVVQQIHFNNHFSQQLEEQCQSMKEPSYELYKQNTKLNEICSITKTVAEHQIKIKTLKHQNGMMSKKWVIFPIITICCKFENSKSSITNSSLKPLSQTITPGLLSQSVPDLHVMVGKVLTILEVPPHILS